MSGAFRLPWTEGGGTGKRAEYLRSIHPQVRSIGLAAGVLICLLFLAWALLDWILEPARAAELTRIRLLGTGVTLAALILLYRHPYARRHPEPFVFAVMVIPALFQAWMVPRVESLDAYLLGYSLVIWISAFLLHSSFPWVALIVATALSALPVSYALQPEELTPREVSVAAFFLISASAISLLAALFRDRTSFREFLTRRALEHERDRTDRLLEQLERLSNEDPLTRLQNRRAWERALRAAWTPPEDGTHLAVMLLDLDHFKEVNDRYGHEGGDRALAALGQILRRVAPKEAMTARLGGDEFGILLPGFDLEAAGRVACEIAEKVAALRMTRLRDLELTISVGVATLEAGDLEPADLMRRADEQLYAAKETRQAVWGGNRRLDREAWSKTATILRHEPEKTPAPAAPPKPPTTAE